MTSKINVEVCYINNNLQILRKISCEHGSTSKEIISAANMDCYLNNNEIVSSFGKILDINKPITEDTRIEIIRRLKLDPKSSRMKKVKHERNHQQPD